MIHTTQILNIFVVNYRVRDCLLLHYMYDVRILSTYTHILVKFPGHALVCVVQASPFPPPLPLPFSSSPSTSTPLLSGESEKTSLQRSKESVLSFVRRMEHLPLAFGFANTLFQKQRLKGQPVQCRVNCRMTGASTREGDEKAGQKDDNDARFSTMILDAQPGQAPKTKNQSFPPPPFQPRPSQTPPPFPIRS